MSEEDLNTLVSDLGGDEVDSLVSSRFDELEIGQICTLIEPFSCFMDLNTLRNRLDEFSPVNSLPVEKDGGVIGLIKKSTVIEKTKSAIGSLLTKALDSYIEKSPFIVDAHENVEKVLSQIIREHSVEMDEDILIYYQGRYLGVVNFKTLLVRVNQIREQDMTQAKEVQEYRIQKSLSIDSCLEAAFFIQMAHSIGGDYIQMADLNRNLTLYGAFDVSGKNVTGALTTAVISSFFSMLRQTPREDIWLTPKEICISLNKVLCDQTTLNVFVVGVMIFIDKKKNELQVYNYGFNPVYLFNSAQNNKFSRVKALYPPLGLDENESMDTPPVVIPICPGLKVFSYSDGLTDVKNMEAQMYGEEEAHRLIVQKSSHHAKAMVDAIALELNNYKGEAPQSDDISLMAIDFKSIYPAS